MYQHEYKYLRSGPIAGEARGALVLVHGRGGTAAEIIRLSAALGADHLSIFAPQATNNSWYPYSFLEKESLNQPALDSAIGILDKLVNEIISSGVAKEKVILAGFSQGACLCLEYVARYGSKYGGVIAFTGGLIGKTLDIGKYSGALFNTPVLLSTGSQDLHVPLERVEATAAYLRSANAEVFIDVYPGKMHSVSKTELDRASETVLSKL